MSDSIFRKRLTRFDDVRMLVDELRIRGHSGPELYRRATDIAVLDLDMLNEVLAGHTLQRS